MLSNPQSPVDIYVTFLLHDRSSWLNFAAVKKRFKEWHHLLYMINM